IGRGRVFKPRRWPQNARLPGRGARTAGSTVRWGLGRVRDRDPIASADGSGGLWQPAVVVDVHVVVEALAGELAAQLLVSDGRVRAGGRLARRCGALRVLRVLGVLFRSCDGLLQLLERPGQMR